ncbi:AAA-like domain-containing protein [uncultured Nostoc sp.]|uniref:AAA-like domain-containing protein n=1 Tax=uncultured Nostoc sp. TaxID=340711 RepID=UPI0035C9CA5A
MNSTFTYEEALEFAHQLLSIKSNNLLTDLEEKIFRGCWEDRDYVDIAETLGYSTGRITEVGSQLWSKLSTALGERISKKTFRQPLRREWEKQYPTSKTRLSEFLIAPQSLKDALNHDFDYYVERPLIEQHCLLEILKPGCLLRIKAPWQTGKTELVSKLMYHIAQKGYQTAVFNLRDATKEDFENLDKFLQWFCTLLANRLELIYSVEEHWHKSLGNSKIKCRNYFEKYLLVGDSPLILCLDEVDRIFPYREIASEFLGMLRTWHEDSKTRQLWRQFRLIIAHSEVYTEVDINQSPFNAGCEITLTDFNQEQVLYLAQQYKLDWNMTQVVQLMAMIGGHPFLVNEAFKKVAQLGMTFEELLQISHKTWGIYYYHLERHWRNLQSNPELADAFQKIVLASTAVEFHSGLNQSIIVKLNDLGLVKLLSNGVIPRYELYRHYYRNRFQNSL